jgi:hypothetical protein
VQLYEVRQLNNWTELLCSNGELERVGSRDYMIQQHRVKRVFAIQFFVIAIKRPTGTISRPLLCQKNGSGGGGGGEFALKFFVIN